MFRMILFWTLFPFVLAQAIRVRKSAPKVTVHSPHVFTATRDGFPRYNPYALRCHVERKAVSLGGSERLPPKVSAAGGPRDGTVGAGRDFELIAIGDSIISGVGASTLANALVGQASQKLSKTLNCRINWTAYGSIGARSSKILDQLTPKLNDTEADFIILLVGLNDVTALSSVSNWMRNLYAILNGLTQTHDKGSRYPVQSYMLYQPRTIEPMKRLEDKLSDS